MKLPQSRRAIARENAIREAERDFEDKPLPPAMFEIGPAPLQPPDRMDIQGDLTVSRDIIGPTIYRLRRRVLTLEVLVIFLAGVVFWVLVR